MVTDCQVYIADVETSWQFVILTVNSVLMYTISDMFGLFRRQIPGSIVCSHMHPLDTRGGNVSAAANNLTNRGKHRWRLMLLDSTLFILYFTVYCLVWANYMKNIFKIHRITASQMWLFFSFFTFDRNLSTSGLWTKQDIWGCLLWLWEALINIMTMNMIIDWPTGGL